MRPEGCSPRHIKVSIRLGRRKVHGQDCADRGYPLALLALAWPRQIATPTAGLAHNIYTTYGRGTLHLTPDRITSPFDLMELLILGAGMGMVGGVFPNPLHMIALTQVALGRWGRAIFVLLGPPLVVDGAFLFLTLFFFRVVPLGIVHYVAYAGGLLVTSFAAYSLWELRGKTQEQVASSATFTAAGVSVATLAEVAAPGTWIYWVTIAGPVLAEGRVKGYLHVAPFFAGGLLGYYGAALLSTWLMAWGAGLHKKFRKHLFLAANILLLLMGISYFVRAYVGTRGGFFQSHGS